MKKEIINEVKKMMKSNPKYTQSDLKKAVTKADDVIYRIKNNLFDGKIFKYGNLKLEKNIARFTLPEVITCKARCPGCYASKMLWESTRIYRLTNLLIIMNALRDKDFNNHFTKQIQKELQLHEKKCKRAGKLPMFRWHDSGDIFSVEYFNWMREVMSTNLNIKFYTYTKNTQVYQTYLMLKNIEPSMLNFNIVNSFILHHVNYFDFMHNFEVEFDIFKKIVETLKERGKKLFFCNYNFEKFKERDCKNYEKLIQYFKDNSDVISFFEKHLDCGDCSACCSFEYTAFLKH